MRRKEDLTTDAPLAPLSPDPAPLEGAWRFALPILLALYLCFATLHAMTAPVGFTGLQNAPDEAAHVFMAKEFHAGRYPTQQSASGNPLGYEWHQPPLYYFVAARFVPLGEKAIRFASIAFGLLALALIFRAGRNLFPKDPLAPTLATGFAALIPSHIAITSSVNNDAPAEALFSWAILLLIYSYRSGFTARRALYLGLAIGLALLTKATALLLIPIALFGLILLRKSGEETRRMLSNAALCFGVAFLISGAWFIRNAALYGEFLPLQSFKKAFAGTAQASDFVKAGGWGAYLSLTGQWTFQSFWAVFGTPDSATKGKGTPLFLPFPALYALFAGWTIAVLAGMTRLHFKAKALYSKVQLMGFWTLFTTIALTTASFAGFLLTYFQTQGRYLYPAMLPIAICSSMGWLALFPEKGKRAAGFGFLGFLGLVSILYFSVITP